jgi:hypothetical protein
LMKYLSREAKNWKGTWKFKFALFKEKKNILFFPNF